MLHLIINVKFIYNRPDRMRIEQKCKLFVAILQFRQFTAIETESGSFVNMNINMDRRIFVIVNTFMMLTL